MTMQDTFPTIGKAALEYAEKHGWHVFPAPLGSRKSYKRIRLQEAGCA